MMWNKSDQQGDRKVDRARLWLEQHWQPALVTAELENGWLVVFAHQSQPLFLNRHFFSTAAAVEPDELLDAAVLRNLRQFGMGLRFH